MNVLIIGSKGFIGTHAYSFFSRKQNTVCWGCDVVADYNDDRYFLLDAVDSDYRETFEKASFDICINCSGTGSVPGSFKGPQRDFNLNVFAVIKILDAIRKYAPGCKFINLSSAAVYGNPQRLPVTETDSCSPVSPYGLHKQFAENICLEYHTYFGLQTCSLRIFSAYGPGLKKQLFWDIFKKAKQPDGVTLFGTGLETRDFIYIIDLLHAIDLVIAKGSFDGSIYNVGNGVETEIRTVAESLLNSLNYKGPLSFSGSNRTGDPIKWRADISRIQSLGYQQCYSLEQGIKQFVLWATEKE